MTHFEQRCVCVCVCVLPGTYSDSAGVEVIRRHIADYITQRDGGIAADYNDVFLTNGASEGIKVGYWSQMLLVRTPSLAPSPQPVGLTLRTNYLLD